MKDKLPQGETFYGKLRSEEKLLLSQYRVLLGSVEASLKSGSGDSFSLCLQKEGQLQKRLKNLYTCISRWERGEDDIVSQDGLRLIEAIASVREKIEHEKESLERELEAIKRPKASPLYREEQPSYIDIEG